MRPLTLTTPKPMLPLAGIPFITHQLLRARQAGVEHVVLATSYRAAMFRDHFADGAGLGLALSYAVEDEPLGTGGALRNAAGHLRGDGPVIILNGDVLGGLDLAALVDRHRHGGAEVTLHLRRVPDPAAYGVVTTDPDGRVLAFEEKTRHPSTDQINAGTYVFSRPALLSIPPGRVVSVERETFPRLIAAGSRILSLLDDDAYWLDIGTPATYIRGNCDLVTGLAPAAAGHAPPGERLVLAGAEIGDGAELSGGTVVGRNAEIAAGAQLHRSVIFDNARIGRGARLTDTVVGGGARVGAGAVLNGVMLGDLTEVRPGARLLAATATAG
ncbi:NDP-sugar synthase [Paractinoplanes ferrugineus]|uniref:Mannose-1-phosphate guanylyltransferase n=1 Tax=Paractinoplanes ferrugineus TaxID=113564 RepID=A0A919J6S0_9ACTN|nr:mannose-1-phosphate guanylyltransferase [Actinoplanes ferrugineus]